jgi:hypothetical protein
MRRSSKAQYAVIGARYNKSGFGTLRDRLPKREVAARSNSCAHVIASGFSPQNDTAEMLDPLEHAARSFEALPAAARGWPKLSHSPLGAYLECKVEDASESGKSTKPATSCP